MLLQRRRFSPLSLFLVLAVFVSNALAADVEERLKVLMQDYWAQNTQGDMGGAARIAIQAAELLENSGRTDHRMYPVVLNHAGLFLQRSDSYAASIPYLEKSYRAAVSIHGAASEVAINALGSLGSAYSHMDDYANSETRFEQAVQLIEQHHQHSDAEFSHIYNNYAFLRLRQGQYAAAIPLIEKALDYVQTHPQLARDASHGNMYNNLANAHWKSGNLDEASRQYLRSQEVLEQYGHTKTVVYAETLTGLAAVYEKKQQYSQALAVQEAAIRLYEEIAPRSVRQALALNNKGTILRAMGRGDEAKGLFQQAWRMVESIGAGNDPSALIIKHNVGISHDDGYFGKVQGIKAARELLKDNRAFYGELHPQTAGAYYNLGISLSNFGEFEEAEEMMAKAIRVYRESVGDTSQELLLVYHQTALVYESREDYRKALDYIRKASDIQRARIARGAVSSQAVVEENKRLRSLFIDHIKIIHSLVRQGAGSPALINEAFEAGQMARSTSTATALAQMGARFLSSNKGLSELLREYQDQTSRLAKLTGALTQALSAKGQERQQAGRLKKELLALNERIDAMEQRLATEFPAYKELTSPLPVAAKDVQRLLSGDELFLSYVVGKDFTWLFAISDDQVGFHRIEIDGKGLDSGIGYLREELEAPDEQSLEDFDASLAFQIYERLFSPVRQQLASHHRLHVVPDGSLQSIPFSLLVTKDPDFGDDSFKGLSWFARTHAISYLPSASSFRLLRRQTGQSRASKPFLGVGDPILAGHPDGAAEASLQAMYAARGVADVDNVRALPALPETADELEKMTAIVGGGSTLLLRKLATETQLKSTALDQYRVIAFATHGLLAGELGDNAEPALVLTPPAKGSLQDDGLLTASEIAGLTLDADLAILSACNTAASDGSPNADGFSGLTKAFFYAGARSLLVSHWPVDSYATVQLTTELLQQAKSGVGYSEALRRSSLKLMDHPRYGHPFFWAPFVIVGQ